MLKIHHLAYLPREIESYENITQLDEEGPGRLSQSDLNKKLAIQPTQQPTKQLTQQPTEQPSEQLNNLPTEQLTPDLPGNDPIPSTTPDLSVTKYISGSSKDLRRKSDGVESARMSEMINYTVNPIEFGESSRSTDSTASNFPQSSLDSPQSSHCVSETRPIIPRSIWRHATVASVLSNRCTVLAQIWALCFSEEQLTPL